MHRMIDPAGQAIGACIAVISGRLGQAAPIPGAEIIDVVKTYGIMSGLVIFFIYWSRQRESAMSDRMRQLEDFIHGKFTDALERNTAALNAIVDATRDCPALQTVRPKLEAIVRPQGANP